MLRSDFSGWAWATVGPAVLTCAATAVFWRSGWTRRAAAVGTLLAALGVFGGLLVDIVGSAA